MFGSTSNKKKIIGYFIVIRFLKEKKGDYTHQDVEYLLWSLKYYSAQQIM